MVLSVFIIAEVVLIVLNPVDWHGFPTHVCLAGCKCGQLIFSPVKSLLGALKTLLRPTLFKMSCGFSFSF